MIEIEGPSELPDIQKISEIQEPWLDLSIITPSTFIGAVMDLVTNNRGTYKTMAVSYTHLTLPTKA